MSATETWTIGKLLTWTADYLKRSGSQSPRLDAEVLLAHARGCQRIELYTAFDEEPAQETRTAFREMVRRRAEGTPVAYLVGFKEFYSMTFEVNPDVLIPRPETEHLVVTALDCAKTLDRAGAQLDDQCPLQIVDVGTGCGAIAVTVAKHLPSCCVTAVDISPAALEVAARNAQRHAIAADRLQFVQGDMLTWCQPNQRFDLILSNPPYVSIEEFQQLPATVREYEPRLALLAEQGPVELYRRLIQQAAQHLDKGGRLIFEFSPMLGDQLSAMITPADSWAEPQITKDLSGHARVVTLRRS